MIGSLLLLPASLLAAQITISEVTAQREGGRVAITVKGDAMIDPEATSAKVGEGRLYLFVYDAHVRENNRAWKNDVDEGAEEIRAHRHKQKVELAIPLGDSGCQGPVELEKAPGGLRALVACDGGPRPSATRSARAAATATPRAEAAKPEAAKPESRVTALPAASSPTAVKAEGLGAALKAKLSLDPEPAAKPAAKPANAARAAAPASKPAVAETKPASAPPAAGVSSTSTPTPTPTVELTGSPSGAGNVPNSGVFLGGGALLALAAAAFYFSRRRAAGRERHIQILETASLGPKRALVVARVGDATMILGSSEAGITLLQSVPDADSSRSSGGGISVPELSFAPAATAIGGAGAVATASDPPPPPKIIVEEAQSRAPVAVVPIAGTNNTWSIDANGLPAVDDEITGPPLDAQVEGQHGLLSRLFKRGAPANDSPRFEDILEDSFEDQELRRKLALGLPGRVR